MALPLVTFIQRAVPRLRAQREGRLQDGEAVEGPPPLNTAKAACELPAWRADRGFVVHWVRGRGGVAQQARVPVRKEHETPLAHTGDEVPISSGLLTPRAGMQIGSDTVRVGTALRWRRQGRPQGQTWLWGRVATRLSELHLHPDPQDVPPGRCLKAKCEEMTFWNQGMHDVALFPGDSFFTYIFSLKTVLKVVWFIELEEKMEEKGMEKDDGFSE